MLVHFGLKINLDDLFHQWQTIFELGTMDVVHHLVVMWWSEPHNHFECDQQP